MWRNIVDGSVLNATYTFTTRYRSLISHFRILGSVPFRDNYVSNSACRQLPIFAALPLLSTVVVAILVRL